MLSPLSGPIFYYGLKFQFKTLGSVGQQVLFEKKEL